MAGATTTDARQRRPRTRTNTSKAPPSAGPSSSRASVSGVRLRRPSQASVSGAAQLRGHPALDELVPELRDTGVGEHLHPVRRARAARAARSARPAWLRRSAYSMSSSRKPSAPPTITIAGGRPVRSVAPRRRRGVRDVVGAVEIAEVALPAERVRLAAPDRAGRRGGSTRCAGGRRSSGTRAAGTRADLTTVAREQRERGREATAGADPAMPMRSRSTPSSSAWS